MQSHEIKRERGRDTQNHVYRLGTLRINGFYIRGCFNAVAKHLMNLAPMGMMFLNITRRYLVWRVGLEF